MENQIARWALSALVLGAGMTTFACKASPEGAPDKPAPASAASPAAASSAGATTASLKGICPDKIVIQTDWFATPERAAAYQLVGAEGTVDKKKGTYSGPLADTGVAVEVRLGGPFIGFQPIPALMYQDPSIFLGYVATDDAVQAADKFKTMAVVAPLEINPQILMWDPASYSIAAWPDVAKSKAKVLYLEGLPFMDYLVSKQYVSKAQTDASFDGTPSRFVAEGGKLIQQGYASNEPYRWEHDVAAWKKPVKFLLVHDSGYEIYPQGLAVRAGELEQARPCLKALVPLIQKAQIAYISDPAPVNGALVRIASELGDGPPVTAAGNANAAVVMKQLGIVANGSNSTLGDFDLARVERTIALLRPIFAARSVTVKAELAPSELVTNEFIDPALHL
ncbi:MAG: ABC transporter substrate-binding protein [Polyangiaceae bacterium]